MKNLIYLTAAILIIGCQGNNYSTDKSENQFIPMIQEEITYVKKNLEGLEKDKGQDWYAGDSAFFSNWLKGANEELEGNYKKAAEYYTNALKTKRYEISSYEVKLSLGRLYMQMNEKEKARKMLTEFKMEAQRDLSGEEVEWGLTDEAKESLAMDIEDCNYLLRMLENSK